MRHDEHGIKVNGWNLTWGAAVRLVFVYTSLIAGWFTLRAEIKELRRDINTTSGIVTIRLDKDIAALQAANADTREWRADVNAQLRELQRRRSTTYEVSEARRIEQPRIYGR